jgi:hypothetical protein
MFPWKDFLMGRIRKIQKQKEERGRSRESKKNKKEKNGGKKKKRFLCMWRFPYSCVFHWSGMPWDYRPHATLPQENPLIWEPPLQQKFPINTGVKIGVPGREITVWYSPAQISAVVMGPSFMFVNFPGTKLW